MNAVAAVLMCLLATSPLVLAQDDSDQDTMVTESGELTPNPEVLERFTKALNECKTNFPISVENLGSFFKTGLLKNETDEVGQCFTNCVMEKGSLVVDGKFDGDSAKKLIVERFSLLFGGKPLTQDSVDKAVEECTTSEESNCEINYKIWSCLYQTLHQD